MTGAKLSSKKEVTNTLTTTSPFPIAEILIVNYTLGLYFVTKYVPSKTVQVAAVTWRGNRTFNCSRVTESP